MKFSFVSYTRNYRYRANKATEIKKITVIVEETLWVSSYLRVNRSKSRDIQIWNLKEIFSPFTWLDLLTDSFTNEVTLSLTVVNRIEDTIFDSIFL